VVLIQLDENMHMIRHTADRNNQTSQPLFDIHPKMFKQHWLDPFGDQRLIVFGMEDHMDPYVKQ